MQTQHDLRTQKAIRICVMAPALPPAIGGAESGAEAYIISLARVGVVIDLMTASDPDVEIVNAVYQSGGEVFTVPLEIPGEKVGWEYQTFSRSEQLDTILSERSPDVVHTFSHDTALSAAICMEEIQRPPLLVGSFSEMATESTEMGDRRSHFIYGLQRLDAIVAPSRFYGDIAKRYGILPEHLAIIPPGIDCPRFEAGSRKIGRKFLDVPDEEFLLVCPGRMSPRKGQIDLIRALRIVHSQGLKFRAVFTGSIHSGDPDYHEQLIQAIDQMELSECVNLQLGLPKSIMPHILASASIVVQPSHWEGLGTAALESMAAGTTLVLTSTSGFSEIARHLETAYMVPPEDPNALARAILWLAKDERTRTTIAHRAREHVRSNFSMDVLAKRALAYLESLLYRMTRTGRQPE